MEISFTIAVILLPVLWINTCFSDEYCEDQEFAAECKIGELIRIDSALYGRMKRNQCVTRDHGHLGCYVDRLEYLDTVCSGKRSCKFKVIDHKSELGDDVIGCPVDFSSYLSIEYQCVQVLYPETSLCYTENEIAVNTMSTQPHGFIASAISQTTIIGSQHCPYVFNIPHGKTLNISLYNFGAYKQRKEELHTCLELATIKVGIESRMITLCNDLGRGRSVEVIDNGGVVKIEIVSASALKFIGQFLLEYQVTGCDTPIPKDNMQISRSGDELVVSCDHSDVIKSITCAGNYWSEALPNCPAEINDDSGWTEAFVDEEFPFGILIIVAIGVALGVFLGGLLLTVFAMHMKRKQRETMRKMTYMPPPELSPLDTMIRSDALDFGTDCTQCTIERAHGRMASLKLPNSVTYSPASTTSTVNTLPDNKDIPSNALSSHYEKNRARDYNSSNTGGLMKENKNLTSSNRTFQPTPVSRSHNYELPNFT